MGKINRCSWATSNKPMQDYHDNEWGKVQKDEQKIFEQLSLESMQSGLSWEIVLKKRENFRKAFLNFDYNDVAHFDEKMVEQLLENEGIIRHRMKIEAVINNAKLISKMNAEGQSLSELLWSYVDNKPIINDFKDDQGVPSKTDLSIKISKDLKKLGFKFLGPVTIYAFMQSCGMVNDHSADCQFK